MRCVVDGAAGTVDAGTFAGLSSDSYRQSSSADVNRFVNSEFLRVPQTSRHTGDNGWR